MLPTKQDVQLRSYQIWEQEGRPNGRDQEHWFQAERELAAKERAVKTVAARSAAGASAKAASTPSKKAGTKAKKPASRQR
jgi:hypothetical protein